MRHNENQLGEKVHTLGLFVLLLLSLFVWVCLVSCVLHGLYNKACMVDVITKKYYSHRTEPLPLAVNMARLH